MTVWYKNHSCLAKPVPSPTLTPTDPVPRGLLTLCRGASSGQGKGPSGTLPRWHAGTLCAGFGSVLVLAADAAGRGREVDHRENQGVLWGKKRDYFVSSTGHGILAQAARFCRLVSLLPSSVRVSRSRPAS